MIFKSTLALPLLAAAVYADASNPHLVAESYEFNVKEARQTNDGQFTFYTGFTAASGPCDLAYNPYDRNLYGEEQFVNNLFQLNPNTGKITEYPIPYTTPLSNRTAPNIPGLPGVIGDRTKFSCAIRDGKDGNMYASNGVNNQLVQLNTRTKAIKIFQNPANPTGNLFPFNDLYSDSKGMWVTQTTGNVIQYFSFAAQSFILQRTVPTPLALPLGIFVASDGLVYGAEVLANKIFTYNKATDQFREYPLPGTMLQGTPAVIRAEKNGWVYFTLLFGNGLGRINMKTHIIELYPTNQNPGFGSVNTGPANDGRVWMSYFTSTNALAGFSDATKTYKIVPFPGTFAQFGLPGLAGAIPPYLNIAVNYRPGNALWFSSPSFTAVGRYAVSSTRRRDAAEQ